MRRMLTQYSLGVGPGQADGLFNIGWRWCGLGGHPRNIHLVYVMVSLTGYPILGVGSVGLGGPLPNIHLV